MNEFQLIARLTQSLPGHPAVEVGPGDDCAVLDLGVPGKQFLFKTDAVVEGIHFTRETPPEKIGHKALARGLSDLAAMAVAAGAVLTLDTDETAKHPGAAAVAGVSRGSKLTATISKPSPLRSGAAMLASAAASPLARAPASP